MDAMIISFDFFIKGDWHYESKKLFELIDMLSPEEKVEFECDVRKIRWLHFLELFAKGLAIWVLQEDQIAPEHNLDQLMLKQKHYGDDLRQVAKYQPNLIEKDLQDYEARILCE